MQQRPEPGHPAPRPPPHSPFTVPLHRAEQVHRRPHPAVVRDHVAGPAGQHRVADRRRPRGVGHIAQAGHAERQRRLLTLGPALRVPAVGQRVPCAGVHHEQREPGRRRVERHGGGLPAAAVEQQRVPLLTQQRRGLVHDPAGHTDHLVLCPPRQGGEFGPRHVRPVKVGEGDRHGALDRGRGRQASALWQVGVDNQAGPAYGEAGLPHGPGDTGRVGGPAGHAAGAQPGQPHDGLALGL